MKIELFSNSDIAKCQNQVNQFLHECDKNNLAVQDIKFAVTSHENGEEVLYTAMVIISNATSSLDKTKEELI